MKTQGLNTIAGTRRTTTAPNANMINSNIASAIVQPTKQVDNTQALIGDIGKMLGGLVKTHQKASKVAGERVGVDNLIAYKNEMDTLNQQYASKKNLTSSDFINKTAQEKLIYDKYMEKGVFKDNEIANQGFKDTYGIPATKLLMSKKLQNINNQKKLFIKEEVTDISNSVHNLDFMLNKTIIDGFKKRYADIGLDPKDVDKMVLQRRSTTLATEIKNNTSEYFTAGGQIKQDKIDALIGDTYSTYINSKDSELISKINKSKEQVNSYIETRANQAKRDYYNSAVSVASAYTFKGVPYTDENGITHHFANQKEYENMLSVQFPELSKTDHTKLMDKYKDLTTVKNAQASIKIWKNNFDEKVNKILNAGFTPDKDTVQSLIKEAGILIKSKTLTSTQEATIKIELEKAKAIQSGNNIVNGIIDNVVDGKTTIEDAIDTINRGMVNPFNNKLISHTQFNTIAEKRISDISQNISNIKMDKDNIPKFHNKLKELNKLEKLTTGDTPSLFSRFDNILRDKTNIDNMSMNDIHQFIEYIKYQHDNNPSGIYQAYFGDVVAVQQKLNDLALDAKTPSSEKLINAKVYMKNMLKFPNVPPNGRILMAKAVKNYIGDKGFNETTAQGISHVLMTLYTGANYSNDNLKKFINTFETYDMPSAGHIFSNKRIIKSQSFKDSHVEWLINAEIKAYNKDIHHTKIGLNDVEPIAFTKTKNGEATGIAYYLMVETPNGMQSIGELSEDVYKKAYRKQ